MSLPEHHEGTVDTTSATPLTPDNTTEEDTLWLNIVSPDATEQFPAAENLSTGASASPCHVSVQKTTGSLFPVYRCTRADCCGAKYHCPLCPHSQDSALKEDDVRIHFAAVHLNECVVINGKLH